MRHPFEVFDPAVRRWLYWIFFAATIAMSVALTNIGATFAEKRGPTGRSYDIIAFELAHTPGRAAEIVETWGRDGIAAARLQTYLDFGFLMLYSNAIALGVISIMSAAADRSFIPGLGRALAYGQWVAGLFDAVENLALLQILNGDVGSPWPQIAYYFATIKFALVGLGLLYILIYLPYAGRETSSDAVIGMGE